MVKLSKDTAYRNRHAVAPLAQRSGVDLERIFSHYAEDFVFSSPVIRERGFAESGILRGKDAMRPYWSLGLGAKPPIVFEILDVFAGSDCVTIHYRSVGRALVCETFFFDAAGAVNT